MRISVVQCCASGAVRQEALIHGRCVVGLGSEELLLQALSQNVHLKSSRWISLRPDSYETRKRNPLSPPCLGMHMHITDVNRHSLTIV